jgi:hypothetical protein
MQKKTLLYAFGIAAFLGLVLGTGFFANEVRLKILQGPDKNELENELSQYSLPALDKLSGKKTSDSKTPPTTNAGLAEGLNSPAPTPTQQAPEATTEAAPAPTAPPPAEEKTSFSFAILGDTQRFDPGNAGGSLQKAVKSIEEKNVGLVVTEGDLLGSCDGKSGCEKKLGEWKNTLGSLYSKTYEMMGNHDRTGGDNADALWQKFFDLPQNGPDGYKELVYSFDHENSHFVVLNSEKPDEHAVDKAQRDWLEKDLQDSQKDNKFVFFHEPAYPVSSKIDESLDADASDRDALWQIFKDQKVTAVFNGHEHIQSRRKVDGVYQFVFGNTDSFDHELPKAGVADYSYKGEHFGIVEIKGKEVTVNVYSVDGNLLDSFKIPA